MPMNTESNLNNIDQIQRTETNGVSLQCISSIREREQPLARTPQDATTTVALQLLAENTELVIWIADALLQNFIYINPKFEQVWGRDRTEFYNQPSALCDTIHPADRDRFKHSRKKLVEGVGSQSEYRLLMPDGSFRWIRDHTMVLRNAKGQICRLIGTAIDDTDFRNVQDHYRHAQKLASLGQLAVGAAHDFNDVLAASLMHIGLLKHSPEFPAEVKVVLSEVEDEIERGSHLTRQLLLFSRRDTAVLRSVDINVIVKHMLKMIRRLIGEHIEVRFHSEADVAWVHADPGMLEQVIMNLCLNARDAMPNGGALSISTSLVKRQSRSQLRQQQRTAEQYICLSVGDTGHGIADSAFQNIFEPFFTTKPIGDGTGLGLPMVRSIVEQHEGWIEVESTKAKGTLFRIHLPAGPGPDSQEALSRSGEVVLGGDETVLLVEDDLPMRRSLALFLRSLGYPVLEVGDGGEALNIWDQNRNSIRILLADIGIPGSVNGRDLASRLRQDNPALGVILLTGYSEDYLQAEKADPERIAYLAKPFRVTRLAKAIRECLDGKA